MITEKLSQLLDSNLVVEENTGTQGSPVWTTLTQGLYGKAELADVDVLYDNVAHWLQFNVAPSDFDNAIRVTGSIRRPIRVRLEDIGAGEQTYAATLENKNITSIDQALGFANSKLNQRNAVKILTFKTYEPGLIAGQQINVTDTNRGLNEDLVIQHINTKWISPAKALFTVTCGTDESVGVDTIIANNDKRSRDNQLSAGATTVTYTSITDANSLILTDVYGRTVYGIKS